MAVLPRLRGPVCLECFRAATGHYPLPGGGRASALTVREGQFVTRSAGGRRVRRLPTPGMQRVAPGQLSWWERQRQFRAMLEQLRIDPKSSKGLVAAVAVPITVDEDDDDATGP